MDLSGLSEAQKLTFEIFLTGTTFKNQWDFWVYPVKQVEAV